MYFQRRNTLDESCKSLTLLAFCKATSSDKFDRFNSLVTAITCGLLVAESFFASNSLSCANKSQIP